MIFSLLCSALSLLVMKTTFRRGRNFREKKKEMQMVSRPEVKANIRFALSIVISNSFSPFVTKQESFQRRSYPKQETKKEKKNHNQCPHQLLLPRVPRHLAVRLLK
jgi:hypothetical protein